MPHCTLESLVSTAFWSEVDRSGECWLWPRANNRGYGTFRLGRRNVQVHRLAWILRRGPIPEGMEVCHNCPGGDNPLCVNPDHLFLGTHLENMRDAIRKGRSSVGAPQKLTIEKVREIRHRYADGGVSTTALAREYGIGQSTVMHVLKGRIWQEVTG